jgi:predicted nucleic acid-binding protein
VTGFVLDASVVMAWCFEEEGGPDTDAILTRLKGEAALVPQVWPFEIANVLATAERRGRITPDQSASFIEFLRPLPITIDRTASALSELLSASRASRLTAYDAAYLILSIVHGLPLATRDRAQARAAKAVGVRLLP